MIDYQILMRAMEEALAGGGQLPPGPGPGPAGPMPSPSPQPQPQPQPPPPPMTRTGVPGVDMYLEKIQDITPSLDQLHPPLPPDQPPQPPPAALRRADDLPGRPMRQPPEQPPELGQRPARPETRLKPLPPRTLRQDPPPGLTPLEPIVDPRALEPLPLVPSARPLPPPEQIAPLEHLPPPTLPAEMTNPYVESTKQGRAPGADEGFGAHLQHALLQTLNPFDPTKPGGQSLLAAGMAALGGAQGGEVVAAANRARSNEQALQDRKRRDHVRKNELRDRHTNAMRRYLAERRQTERTNALDSRAFKQEQNRYLEGMAQADVADRRAWRAAENQRIDRVLGNQREVRDIDRVNETTWRREAGEVQDVDFENATAKRADAVDEIARRERRDAATWQDKVDAQGIKERNADRNSQWRNVYKGVIDENAARVVQDHIDALRRKEGAEDAAYQFQERLRANEIARQDAERDLAMSKAGAAMKLLSAQLSIASQLHSLQKSFEGDDGKRAGLQDATVTVFDGLIQRTIDLTKSGQIDPADGKRMFYELVRMQDSTSRFGAGTYTVAQAARAADGSQPFEGEVTYPPDSPRGRMAEVRRRMGIGTGEKRGNPEAEQQEYDTAVQEWQENRAQRQAGPGQQQGQSAVAAEPFALGPEVAKALQTAMGRPHYQGMNEQQKLDYLKAKVQMATPQKLSSGDLDAIARQAMATIR